MRIVLTNDDGFDAPGLAALHAAVSMLPGVSVRVIAPSIAYSGKGHVVSPEMYCCDTELPTVGRVTVVEGTPGDCVRAAIALPGEPKPDGVIAGINYGSNLGIDVYYSGTAAAAREAAILGIPSIAVSKLVKPNVPTDWEAIARTTAAILAALIDPKGSAPAGLDAELHRVTAGHARSVVAAPGFWNLNLVTMPDGRPVREVELTTLSTDPFQIRYEKSRDERGRLRLTSKGNYHERPAAPGTDVAAAFAGRIALTRVLL